MRGFKHVKNSGEPCLDFLRDLLKAVGSLPDYEGDLDYNTCTLRIRVVHKDRRTYAAVSDLHRGDMCRLVSNYVYPAWSIPVYPEREE